MSLKNLLFGSLCVFIPLLFFYKIILFGLIPFPGDLLVGNFEPYKSSMVGIPHKGQGADVVRELYPWKYFSIESIKNGEFPLWNPYVFSGTPHFASLQAGTLYPVNILFFLLPFIDAWTVYIILQFVFCMFFTYLYLRQIALHRASSIFGSVSFTFCAFITVWGEYGNIGHSLVYLPLVLFSIEKLLQNPKWYWYCLLIFSFVLSVFAGYIQLTMYIYLISSVYLLCKFFSSKKRPRKIYILILGCFVASLLLSAIQLFPLYESVQQSLRGSYSYKDLSERLLPLESLVTFLVPDFFGNPATHNYFMKGGSILERTLHMGLWAFIFAIFALCIKRTFYTMFFAVIGIFLLITCLSWPPITYMQSIGIPFLSTGIPTRILSIVSFCLCVLAAIGFDYYFYSKQRKKILIPIIGIISVIFLCLWITTYVVQDAQLLISRRNLILPTGILLIGSAGILAKFIPRTFIIVLIIALTVFELFYSFQKFNSFVPKSYIYPETEIAQKIREIQGIDRTWGYGNAYIDSELSIMEKLYKTDGYNPLFSKRYGEFLSASENGKILNEIPRNVANIKSGYGTSELKENYYRRRALDLTGTKYVLNKKNDSGIDSAFDETDFKLVWEGNGWQIYENIDFLPRLHMFGNYEVLSDTNKIVERLYSPEFDMKNTVILEEEIPGFNVSSTSASTVKLISYAPNKILLETNSDENQLLFISDNYFPGWKAYVNGALTPVVRANYTFRVIPLPTGKNSVEVYYAPALFKYGVIISFATLACLILVIMFGTLVKHNAFKNQKK